MGQNWLRLESRRHDLFDLWVRLESPVVVLRSSSNIRDG